MLDPQNSLVRERGIWYKVYSHTETYKTRDMQTGELREAQHTHTVKTQLNKRQLRQYKLANSPTDSEIPNIT